MEEVLARNDADMYLRYQKSKTYRVKYQYRNRQRTEVEVWLAVPRETCTQRNLAIQKMTPPICLTESPYSNSIAFYRLKPDEEVHLEYEYDAYRVHLIERSSSDPSHVVEASIRLEDQERAFYLRSTPMIPVNDELRAEAQNIVGEATTPLEQAKKLFKYLIAAYKYTYPPAERGALSMRRLKQGDCGEFSFLFASWCRSLGIPCRVVIGSWASGSSEAHVWNECFVDQIGWVPVDASVAVLLKNAFHKYTFSVAYATPTDPDAYFGHVDGTRVIFSVDANLPLVPMLAERQPPDNWAPVRFAERDFSWGFEAQEGTAPYLQPCYVGFQREGFSHLAAIRAVDLLGSWRVVETSLQQVLLRTKQVFLYAGVGLFGVKEAAHWVFYYEEPPEFALIIPVSYMMYFLCCILRKETNVLVYLLFLVMSGFVASYFL